MAHQPGYEEKHGAIIGAALRILADQGYEALTVDEVMARAQISKGTFYHYFPSKHALVEAALLAVSDSIVNGVAADLGGDIPERLLEPFLDLARPQNDTDTPADRRLAHVLLWTPSLEAFRTRMFGILAQRLTPPVTDALSEGARTGRFQLTDPAATAELLVLLTLSTRARVIALARDSEAEPGQPAAAARSTNAYLTIVERTLGLPPGTFRREYDATASGA
ncbi:MAG: TetR/AcrR family transcriptional regulator [Dactylosporangium sp.]|nr:TetR/AcrR family transcriptional regulator [Dactylosporangium sp.]NNJ60858.1 TetR/AcrR family transcriptional regulator [Dactylosporangium sp.]